MRNSPQRLLQATLILSASITLAAQPSPTIDGYRVAVLPANISSTATAPSSAPVVVAGQPRNCTGHPCTLWDREDIAHFQSMLKTSRELQEHFASLKTEMDARIARPLGMPDQEKEAPTRATYRVHAANAHVISDLGTMYALTGDAKYGEYGRKMLLAYAEGYPKFKHAEGWTPKRYASAQDTRLTGQFLEDGTWLISVARGYDLIYNLPSFTAADRARIHDDLFKAIASEFFDTRAGKQPERSYINATHNRAAICTAATLIAGYATDDRELIDIALYGVGGSKEKPTGGVFGSHFTDLCINTDGLWHEGAMGYHFMALGALLDDAEVLWRHGIDMYRYRNGVLKRLFDSPLQLAYPDLTTPATHDTRRMSLTDNFPNDSIHAYEYGYLRYRDPRYLRCISPQQRSLHLAEHEGPTSVIYDIDLSETARTAPVRVENVNFTDVGYGILRSQAGKGIHSLLFEYGPSRSHGHPDKLAIDLYAFGDVVLPDPGFLFPYGQPMQTNWYLKTLGHCTLTVDEKDQIFFGNRFQFPKTLADPGARQVLYGPGEGIGIQRGMSDTVYPGVTLDRSVFLTPEFMADIFGAFSAAEHKYDLAWHIRGEMTSGLSFKPFQFPEPVKDGYNMLKKVRRAATDKAWSATVTRGGNAVRLHAAPEGDTEVIAGDGYYRVPSGHEPAPAILERRRAASTIYGNVLDISGMPGGHVRGVTQEGSFEAGYGLLKIESVRGSDLCFASYRPGTYQAGGLETDGLQALVLMNGSEVKAMYLGGGKMLKAAGVTLARSQPGLASLERAANGDYVLSNPSPAEAAFTLTLPGLGPNSFTVDLKPSGTLRIPLKR